MKSFQPAVKYEGKLRLAIIGPSGSGKTWTALAIASVLGKRIAVIDTEHGSAAKYANVFTFDHVALDPPYTPSRFIALMNEAATEGYDVVIMDSISHAWAGSGGVLEIKDDYAAQREFSDFTAWRPAGKLQNQFIEAILASDIHVICTMRSKMKYAMDTDDRGKLAVKKVGLAPVQRDSVEYEFDVVLDMNMKNTGVVQKTRCPDLAEQKTWPLPGKELAEVLLAWLKGKKRPPKPHWSETNRGQYMAQLATRGIDEEEACGLLNVPDPKGYKTGKQFFADLDEAIGAAIKDEAHEVGIDAKLAADDADILAPEGTYQDDA